jgi:adenine-specific DNA-methyltransferase
MYDITTPSGKVIRHPPKGWRFSKETFELELAEGKIKFSEDESRIIRKIYLADQEGRVPETIWFSKDVGTTREANNEVRAFVDGDNFDTPKPERLIKRVLELATNPGDLVLDSFAGSGTTGAVAHKMGRRWIMVELGEHCHTHIVPRLKKVIDGEDKGGVTEAVGWKGGGGFRYYKLAPSLIVNDRWGNPVINPAYNAAMLAEALTKLEGFTYAPSEVHWWQHGHSSERDFIYVTTQNLSAEQLQALSEEVGAERSLLVCCSAFRGITAAQAAERWPNLTLKKIPKMVLARCEWGHDDYSLNVANLPMAKPDPVEAPAAAEANKKTKSRKISAASLNQGGLFGESE